MGPSGSIVSKNDTNYDCFLENNLGDDTDHFSEDKTSWKAFSCFKNVMNAFIPSTASLKLTAAFLLHTFAVVGASSCIGNCESSFIDCKNSIFRGGMSCSSRYNWCVTSCRWSS